MSNWSPTITFPTRDTAAGTLLVRCPYGRTFPFSSLYATVYAARGYHVILQSVRGTFGSGGAFEPPVNEAADGADTAAWMRDQPWYTGTFGTVGLSYLGQTQWALLEDPPADMVAAVVVVGVHDFAASSWGTGAFAVNDFLGWSNMVSHQEDPNRLLTALRQTRNRKVVTQVAAEVPLSAAGRTLLGAGAPWWEQWVEHPDVDDPFWDRYRFYGGLDRARVPVLLIGGWQDLFLEQTIEQYHRLHNRNADVALTIGPVDAHAHDHQGRPRRAPRVTGLAGRAPRGPPRATAVARCGCSSPAVAVGGICPPGRRRPLGAVLYLEPGRLAAEPADGRTPRGRRSRSIRDTPTPTVGGRLLSPEQWPPPRRQARRTR